MANKKARTSRARPKEVAEESALSRIPWVDVAGVITGAMGVFTGLALASHRPTDLGQAGPLANKGGMLGAWMADAMMAFLGHAAWIIPLTLCYAGLQLLRLGVSLPRMRPLVGTLLMVLSVTALLHLQLALHFGRPSAQAGGWIGELMGDVALRWAGSVGAYLVLLVGLLLSLQIALAVRVGPLVDRITLALHQVVPALFRWAGEVAVEGSSAARQGLRERIEAWREARAEESEDGHGNPLLDGDEADDPDGEPDGGWDIPVARSKKAPPVASTPRVEPEDDDASEPPADGEDGPEDGGPALSLEEKAAAWRARRMEKRPAGPKIIKNSAAEGVAEAGAAATGALDHEGSATFQLPPLSLLQPPPASNTIGMDEAELHASARVLEQKLRDYGVEGEVVEIHPGPIITMYEYVPAPGIKVSKITNLDNDLAMALKATRIRIVAPLPGKAAVGIEVPNRRRETVYLRENLAHESFGDKNLLLPFALGKNIEGIPVAADMAKMPHLLVAGATGTGKSVAVNSMILSLLFSRTPEEVRLILVDPKMLEFSMYNDIPHLLLPVVTNPKKAAQALNWGVEEMTRRYKLLSRVGARNIGNYNKKVEKELARWEQFGGVPPEYIPWEDQDDDEEPRPPAKLPYIVIIIDELADLMMVAAKEVQDSIVRLAQMARASGIHLLLATQRPSVDVITGLIKANFPSRISFQVSSKTDSRTILDANGAEHLLGMGDLLYLPPGVAQLIRLHAPFCSDDEVRVVTDFLRAQGAPQYEASLIASTSVDDGPAGGEVNEEEYDELYDQAVAIVTESRQVSISGIQRRLKIGYNRSARIVEMMEKDGVISGADHTGKREVLAQPINY